MRKDFQGDVTLQRGIAREVDLPHAAGTQGSDDAVMRNEVVGLKGFAHRWLPRRAGGGFRLKFSTPMRTVWAFAPS
jgi:hypothetical protein